MARQKEFNRKNALISAMKIFWDKSYTGTSIEDLTEVMGISRSSLYDTFGDKKEIFIEALTLYIELTGQKRAGILDKAASVWQGIDSYLHGVVNFVLDENMPGGCFITNSLASFGIMDGQTDSILKKDLENQESDLCRLLEKGKKTGEIRPDTDILALSRYFTGLVRGLTVIARVRKDRKILEAVVNEGIKILDRA